MLSFDSGAVRSMPEVNAMDTYLAKLLDVINVVLCLENRYIHSCSLANWINFYGFLFPANSSMD
ncbi:hypothetical protein AG1IA_07300 [Rhizoctonia solani AG-1 IA]|uniref:Uncharacterized protein n=1 Tax=Thanatephorus cucumeris (strain AG1-IA) TaxID=983506 RepID=L8WKE9_THACA|nr:hypothetical protein AG1IA_07300 [Rhizoctonia solani AG-1 IA]